MGRKLQEAQARRLAANLGSSFDNSAIGQPIAELSNESSCKEPARGRPANSFEDLSDHGNSNSEHSMTEAEIEEALNEYRQLEADIEAHQLAALSQVPPPPEPCADPGCPDPNCTEVRCGQLRPRRSRGRFGGHSFLR